MPRIRIHALRFAGLLLCALDAGCASMSGAPSSAPASSKWIAAWAEADGNASVSAANPAGSSRTFRVILKPSVGSRGTVRVRFSNAFGAAPLTIGAARIGVRLKGASVDSTRQVALSFGSRPAVTIAAGQTVLSDAASLSFSYGTVLAVTEYVSGSWPSLTESDQPLGTVTSYVGPAAGGNAVADAAGTSFTQTTQDTFLVDRVDVFGVYTGTIAAVGSSTTAGYGADLDGFDDWVDDLAKRLHEVGRDDLSVVNLALIPDSLLQTNAVNNNPAIETDFAGRVLSVPGIRTVIQYGGDVDLKTGCDSASAVIAGDRALITQAHAAFVRLILPTVAPATYCGAQVSSTGTRFPAGFGEDAERASLNAWILSTTQTVVDGVSEAPPGADGAVDFSTPVSDPSDTGYPLPSLAVDTAHLNATGQLRQANAIPLELL